MIRPDFQEYLPSYYFSSVNPHTVYPKLQCRLKTDTCIIGGGLSGLCTALPLAEQGHETVVLEAARIGFGASGRSGGQVISDYACGMEEIENRSVWSKRNGFGNSLCRRSNWWTNASANMPLIAIGSAVMPRLPSVRSIGKNCNNGMSTPKNITVQLIINSG